MSTLYITGNEEHTMHFNLHAGESFEEWNADVLDIKAQIRAINENLDAKFRRPHCLRWRQRVIKFVRQCGAGRSPKDILDALKSVELGVGVPVTKFD